MKILVFATSVFILAGGLYYWQNKTPDTWVANFQRIGTFSSPVVADLNNDGELDVIIAAGGAEFERVDTALIALDGASGQVLWAVGASDQLISNPVLLNLNDDTTDDIIVGGRSGQLMAFDGRTGNLLWNFAQEQTLPYPLYNFYTPAPVGDRNGDGIPDLVVAQGGNVQKKPFEVDRPAGMLMLISGADGKLMVADYMPDGKETYMSPATRQHGEDTLVYFGSGGETIEGHFYCVSLNAFEREGLTSARVLVSAEHKGFIAPPVFTDLNRDGHSDILVNAVEGKLIALDGTDHQTLWEVDRDSMEVYTSPAVGHFNNDAVPDVFVNFGKGIWPDMLACRQLAIDGSNGKILFEDSLSFFSMSSPITIDINGDGKDEALLSINFRPQKKTSTGVSFSNEVHNKLMAFDIARNKQLRLDVKMPGPNAAVTPLLDDLDVDGKTDLIFAYQTDAYHMGQFNGMRIFRKELDIPTKRIQQGGYLVQAALPE